LSVASNQQDNVCFSLRLPAAHATAAPALAAKK
jgi:hypothetical protein